MFAGHRIEALGGRGGMGIVYKAVHIRLERTVALKVISPELAVDEGFRQRFQREAQLAASIDHPNVIEIYDADEADGQLYITMRWVQGQDLGTMLERTGRLEPETAVRVIGEVGFALDAAHARGLVHRDIKPGNILIADRDGHVYLTDFGLTREAGEGGGLTRTGMFVGTTDYAAPEQIKGGRVDARTDVYALACVLVQALTGRVPYDRDSEMSKMWAHVNDPPPRLRERVADVPEALEEVVERGMAKDPQDRYPVHRRPRPRGRRRGAGASDADGRADGRHRRRRAGREPRAPGRADRGRDHRVPAGGARRAHRPRRHAARGLPRRDRAAGSAGDGAAAAVAAGAVDAAAASPPGP